MRRKNLYIMEVDVYLAALNLSPEAVVVAKKWNQSNKADSFASQLVGCNGTSNGPKATVSLKFVRDVTTANVVEAFNEAFSGCDANAVTKFKSLLSSVIGKDGVKNGEEVCMYKMFSFCNIHIVLHFPL